MELRVLKVVDRAKAEKLLKEDWVKKTGAVIREGLGGSDGVFLVIKADKETISKLLESGAFSTPENEDELKKAVKEEEESASAGVGLLGF